MSEYKKMKRAAMHTSSAQTDKQLKQQQQTGDTEQQEGEAHTHTCLHTPRQSCVLTFCVLFLGAVLNVLCELRSLSSALINSTDEEDADDE